MQTCLGIKNTREYTTDPYFLLGAIKTNVGKKAKISEKVVEKVYKTRHVLDIYISFDMSK